MSFNTKWRTYLLDGLVFLLPATLCALVVYFLLHFFASPIDRWIETLFPNLPFSFITVEILALATTLSFILLIGYLGRKWILDNLWNAFHRFLLRIPVVRKIFHGCHEVVSSLLRKEERAFSKVTLFEFGDTGGYVIGIVPRSDVDVDHHLPILFPGTPNPLQGFVFFVDKTKTLPSSLPVEKAIKWAISIGSTPLA